MMRGGGERRRGRGRRGGDGPSPIGLPTEPLKELALITSIAPKGYVHKVRGESGIEEEEDDDDE